MGAIFGIVGDGSLLELQVMRQRLAHRGAYHQLWSPASGVYFGQIGRQPLQIDTACPLAEDAQLYEAQSAAGRAELLARDGSEALVRLRGYFSLAFFDASARRLLLAVDQVGFKILYYVVLSDRLAFASEYKALLALPDLIPEPDRDAIQRYLATKQQWIGHTLLARVRAVAGGRMLEWRPDGTAAGTYWQPPIALARRSRAGHAAAVRESLLRTVARQIGARDEIGMTIGGGLDGAVVVGAARRVAPGLRIKSFTIGTGDEDSEILGGRETARIFGTDHHEAVFRRETIPQELPRLVWLCEDCGGREEALLQLNVLGLAGHHADLVIGGHGADRAFGGMPRHRLVSIVELLPRIEAPIREAYFLSQAGTDTQSVTGRALERWLYGNSYPPVPKVPGAGPIEPVTWENRLNSYIRLTIQEMTSLRYLEPAHETAGADFRSPFLDPDFITTSLTVPGRFKVRWGRSKAILRDAVADLIPPAISRRPKAIQRVGQGGGTQLGTILVAMAETVLPGGALESHGLLPAQEMRLAMERCVRPRGRHPGGRREQVYRLWTVLALECWARQFVARRAASWQIGDTD